MWVYALRRLLLLPVTIFCIVLVNFVIINLAPGDPVSYMDISQTGNITKKDNQSMSVEGDVRYLEFREFYGLTLPVLLNTWPFLSVDYVKMTLWQIAHRKFSAQSEEEMSSKDYTDLRKKLGDKARFIMKPLLTVIEDKNISFEERRLALYFFVRGGMRQGIVGPNLSETDKEWNIHITTDDLWLRSLLLSNSASPQEIDTKAQEAATWFEKNSSYYQLDPTESQKFLLLFFETRFVRYISKVFRLDFGTLRSDPNKTVISEVSRRLKYSLTLAIIPMLITFGLCQIFGLLMACNKGSFLDHSLNLVFLVLYSIPVFVAAPFLIEKVALYHCFPFTHTPVPISGFSSPDKIYNNEVSYERLLDICRHLIIPMIAILYGSFATQSRLFRTAALEVLSQDFVRTARAKGLSPLTIAIKHVGRNAAITIITSLAGSLGLVLGGSLIVETLFDINGFGKFFYDAVINRDYNVIMFSAIAGSILTLLGYLVADLCYMWLDPRISLE